MSITGDHRLLKRLNRMACATYARHRKLPGHANATGLTKSTVSLLAELIDEGWLIEQEIDRGSTSRAAGRPPTPLVV